MSYPLDQPIRLTFNTFSDAAETAPADPTTVSLSILLPDGTTTTVTWAAAQVVRDSLGVFHYDYTPATGGHYAWHWVATGAVATSEDGSFDVAVEYGGTIVSVDDFSLYLNNAAAKTDNRAKFILGLAQTLCETVVKPLPTGAEIVVLDVAERAYANPTSTADEALGLYSEGAGPFNTSTPGSAGAGLFLTQENKATLRRLNGTGGAFTIDTIPVTAGQNLPWWDAGSGLVAGDWDTPP